MRLDVLCEGWGSYPRVRTPSRMPAGRGSFSEKRSFRRSTAFSATVMIAFLGRRAFGFFAAPSMGAISAGAVSFDPGVGGTRSITGGTYGAAGATCCAVATELSGRAYPAHHSARCAVRVAALGNAEVDRERAAAEPSCGEWRSAATWLARIRDDCPDGATVRARMGAVAALRSRPAIFSFRGLTETHKRMAQTVTVRAFCQLLHFWAI